MPSKLSIHIRDYPENIWDAIGRMQPRVVKVFDHTSEMNIDTLRLVAKPLVIFRQFTPRNDFESHSADEFMAELGQSGVLSKLAGRGILWEGINEPGIGQDGNKEDVKRAQALNRWYLRFAELMHQRGEKVAGFSWSTGNPTDKQLGWIIPHITEAAAAVDAHAFHEYAKPRSPTPTSDWGRYRLFERALPAHARRPVVITEAGVDDIGDAATSGWAAQISAAEYLQLLARYDEVLAADNYVLGATVYTLKDPGWPSFEIDGEMLGRLSDYIASRGGGTVLGGVWPAPDFLADARAAEVEPSYRFTVEPQVIGAGETATLRWQVEGARAVLLGGREVAPHGEREVNPTRTTGYRLHIEFPDESYKDLDVIVKVTAAALMEEAAPLPSRPPTVTLTPANIENLKRFPRPPGDNGIGLHLHPDLSDKLITEAVEHLKSINATWALMFAQDELRTEKAATACFRAGIMPVVRIGRLIDEATDPIPFVTGLRNALKASDFPHQPEDPPLYVQIYNEPEDDREWKRGRPSNWAEIFGRNWASQAARVYDAGAFPGIQVLDRPGFDAAVDSVIAINRRDLWQRAFFVHHNYGQNHPPIYPYDIPGLTILQDHVAALKFLAHAAWMQERLGFVLPLIGGEGGWWPGNEEDRRYPKVEFPLHAQYTLEMFDWFRSGILSNGEPLPDYLFSITAWIERSWTFGAQNWWGNFLSPDGKLTQTIEAVQAMSSFVRRFSWDAGGEPPTTPGEPPTTPGEPPTTPGEPPTTPGEPPTTPGEPPTTPGEPPTTPGEPPTIPGEPPTTPGEPPTTPPPAVELVWDPRLDDLGVQLTRAADPHAWRLVAARYQDDQQASGRHHVFIHAENADGTPAAGVRFVVDWLGRHSDEVPGSTTTNAHGDGDVPIFITLHPEKKDGIQFAKPADSPGDVVTGLGLPNNHHVAFLLTYRRP